MMQSDVTGFKKVLGELIPSQRLMDDSLRCLAYGTDASFYRMTPKLVVQIESIDELRQMVLAAQYYQVPITFRAAGTSLSGQAITNSVLVLLGKSWQQCDIIENGAIIKLQPGVVGAHANDLLAPLMRRIGPDPASIDTAKIGGIAANNASGMCCGTAHNCYHTLRSMKLVLADGALLDTGDDLSRDMFRDSHKTLLDALSTLAEQVQVNASLSSLIRRKYRLRNTNGYGINALLDFADPIDILQHLMIGSEGTLGFIAEISLDTIPDEPHKATGLLIFASLEGACRAVTELEFQPVSAVELIDRKGLAAVSHMEGMPAGVSAFPPRATALLIEITADSPTMLKERLANVTERLAGWELLAKADFSEDRRIAAQLWSIRKGLFPSVGAIRTTGTTVIIEDVAFPLTSLATGVAALHQLLEKHGYSDAVMFGHALQGNLHFVFTQSFERAEEVERYSRFMDELAHLVAVDHQGSLKAEHGTGRNMAPYVELEWGREAYEVMRDIKTLLDPVGILNPGVLINDDPQVHLKQLKPMPKADPLIDRCIECGFCEPACPSRDLSLTPRQRITSWREIHRLQALGDTDSLQQRTQLLNAYDFAGTDSCAACGLCELRCPVNINTGDLTRAIRGVNNQRWNWIATMIARHFALVVSVARTGLGLLDFIAILVGRSRLALMAGAVHKFSGGKVPLWSAAATAGKRLPRVPIATPATKDTVLYFPACPGRMMDPDLADTMITLLQRAGFKVIVPPGANSQCCGMPFASKGFTDIARDKGVALLDCLESVCDDRPLAVVCDASPCSQQLTALPERGFKLYDSVAFLHENVLPRLSLHALERTVSVHVTCSSQRMERGDSLITLAHACAREVVIPDSVTCCGFAGDKGFTLPALNASALAGLKDELPDDCLWGYSDSRTCEIGLSNHAGIPYRHIAYLMLEASTASKKVPSAHEQ